MKKVLKRVGVVLLCLVLAVVLVVGGYVVYLTAQYSRIEDAQPLTVENQQDMVLQTAVEYSVMTYNIGFGAYDHAFSFFMDTGVMDDGTPVSGAHARAESQEVVRRNTLGAITELEWQDTDFTFLQEVDTDSDRSWHVNQAAEITETFPQEASVFASNFHSAFLAYPLTEPHGAVQSGLLSLSKAHINEAVRHSLPVDESFPTKFFDLDRCFMLMRVPVADGRELVLINLHLSAFDEGGLIRAAQLQLLSAVLAEEAAKGNWVVAGGDFNHALGDTLTAYPSQQQVPGWVYAFDETLLPDGFRVVVAQNIDTVPTCRSTDLPYEEGVNYRVTVDGFIVSGNVSATAENVDTGFAYSDHNPVVLRFMLA